MNFLDYCIYIIDDFVDFKVFKREGRDWERSKIKIFYFLFLDIVKLLD